jgi:hypothetical protein
MTNYRIYYSRIKKDGYDECNFIEKWIGCTEYISGYSKMRKRVEKIRDEIIKSLEDYKDIQPTFELSKDLHGNDEAVLSVSAFRGHTFYYVYLTVTKEK